MVAWTLNFDKYTREEMVITNQSTRRPLTPNCPVDITLFLCLSCRPSWTSCFFLFISASLVFLLQNECCFQFVYWFRRERRHMIFSRKEGWDLNSDLWLPSRKKINQIYTTITLLNFFLRLESEKKTFRADKASQCTLAKRVKRWKSKVEEETGNRLTKHPIN